MTKACWGAFVVTARDGWASLVGQALPKLGSRRPDVLPSLPFSSKFRSAFLSSLHRWSTDVGVVLDAGQGASGDTAKQSTDR